MPLYLAFALIALPPMDLDRVAVELSGLSEHTSQPTYFGLLSEAVTVAGRGDDSSIQRCESLLRRYRAHCSRAQGVTLAADFDCVAKAWLMSATNAEKAAALSKVMAGFHRVQSQMVDREVYWLGQEAGYRESIERESSSEKNLDRLVESLIMISELNWTLGKTAEAWRAREKCGKYVDPSVEDAKSLAYLSHGASLSFRARKYGESIRSYKLILSRESLSPFDRTRMNINLAECFRVNDQLEDSERQVEVANDSLMELVSSDRRTLKLRIVRLRSRLLLDAFRIAEALESYDQTLKLIEAEPKYSPSGKRIVRRLRAHCLSLVGRETEALMEILLVESELVKTGPQALAHRLELIRTRARLASIANQLGLYQLSNTKALAALADFRKLPGHVQSDATLLSILIHLSSSPLATIEEKSLYRSEEYVARLNAYQGSPTAKRRNAMRSAEFAFEQGRSLDGEAICRTLRDDLQQTPFDQMSMSEKNALAYCSLKLARAREWTPRREVVLSPVHSWMSNSIGGLPTWIGEYAAVAFDSGDVVSASKLAKLAISNQHVSYLHLRQKLVSGAVPQRTVSQVAAVIYAGTREMDGQVAGSYWIDSSMAAIRLLAQSRAIRKAGRRSKSDGEAESPTAVAMNDEIASCLLPQIQAKLLQTDVLVHYGHYVPRDDVNRLCQFVVTRNAVTRHELGRVWDVAVAAQAFRAKLKTGQSDFEAAKELGLRLGIPNLKLDQRKRLLISESINTASVPFAALVDLGGKRVVEKASVTQVSAMSALVNLRSSVNSARRVLLVGDVDFASPRDGWHFRTRWPALPATKTEIEDIRASAGGRPVTVLRGLDATKPKAVEAARHCRTIHFATHASVVAKEYSPFDPPVDPLRLSGIVLSGANAIGPAAILTGSEVCMLDLSETRLVVLAGCETSRGSQYADKSIASLRQAFHVAGARSVVSSLWKVDDASTAAFMKLLYHYMWAEDMQPEAAFRQAQVTLFRSPQLIPSLARARGPDFKKVLSRPANTELKARSETQTRLWAAFQFSGAAGR